MPQNNILKRSISALFVELSDEVTEAKAFEALGTRIGPFIVHYRDNGSKVRGEGPYIPNEFARDIARIETKPEPQYPYTKVAKEEPGLFI